jgi:hypothetical protein
VKKNNNTELCYKLHSQTITNLSEKVQQKYLCLLAHVHASLLQACGGEEERVLWEENEVVLPKRSDALM